MASGHVNRTQRPNTWLHRPSLRREDSPCQLGAVHTWPEASVSCVAAPCSELGAKPTCRDCSTGAVDPEPRLTGPFCCNAQVGLPNDMLWCGPARCQFRGQGCV